MPAKLKFRLVYCSSEDPEFPATELNQHSPHTVGWQSARFCEYPQELGFQFAAPVHLLQLQVLSHQFKIASKLELFVGASPEGERPSYQKCKFKRLGYLSLDNNERSNYQARELKSVQLDAYGRFIKIVAHKNHVNKQNMYNQVGLIAINVIGEAARQEGSLPSVLPEGSVAAGRKEISPMDDLTFDLNFDPATANQIRELHVAKDRAVKAEDFDAAARLKGAIERLKSVGARMAKLELRKKAAIENEDYETAKMIKAEIEKLKSGLSLNPKQPPQRHAAGAAVEQAGPPPNQRPSSGNTAAPPPSNHAPFSAGGGKKYGDDRPLPKAPPMDMDMDPYGGDTGPASPEGMPYDDPAHSPPSNASPPKRSPARSAKKTPAPPDDAGGAGPRQIVAPDERPLHNKRAPVFTEFPDDDPRGGGGGGEGPEEIPQSLMAEAEPIIDTFGKDIAQMLYSKNWQNRDQGISKTMKALPRKHGSSRVVGGILKRMLQDKNPTVYLSTLGLLHEFADMGDADIRGALDKSLDVMVTQLGASNTKVKQETQRELLYIAKHPDGGPAYVAPPVLKPPKQTNVWKPILARLEFLEQLLAEHAPTASNGLDLASVMPLVVIGLNSANADTRNKGVDVVHLLYAAEGRKIDPFLKGVSNDATKKLLKEKLADGAPGASRPPPPQPAPAPAKKAGPPKGGPAKGGKQAAADREPEDEVEKVAWYRKKAEAGDADAQYNLAICYEEGKGVKKNERDAARWFGRAAEQGDADAQFSLGVCYHEGKGLEKDDAKAIELWTKAAQQGNEDAKFILGIES